MGRAEKMDCRVNGEVIFTGATTEFQLKKGLTRSESNWNILIHQVLKSKGLNPYLYLSQYLQDDQIEDVFSRPYRSKEQVDRIIELIDLYQICTETLRQEVYKTFKVTET